MKVNDEMIQKMQQDAEKVWNPAFARLVRETKDPFINVINDSDPFEQISWDNMVLVGDGAHPATPHGLRSTNMSVLDVAVLVVCLEKWGAEDLDSAIKEYQCSRASVISKQVMHARRMGRIKQGLDLDDRRPFDPKTATSEDCEELQQEKHGFL